MPNQGKCVSEVLWSLVFKDFMHHDCSMMLTSNCKGVLLHIKIAADLVSQSL